MAGLVCCELVVTVFSVHSHQTHLDLTTRDLLLTELQLYQSSTSRYPCAVCRVCLSVRVPASVQEADLHLFLSGRAPAAPPRHLLPPRPGPATPGTSRPRRSPSVTLLNVKYPSLTQPPL